MSRDVPIEKIHSNTEFKLRFTSPSIEDVTIKLFHVIIRMIESLVTCHLTNICPSRTLFRVMNLIVLWKFDLKHYQGFIWCAQHTLPPVIPLAKDPYHSDSYHLRSDIAPFFHVSSRTKTAIEYPSINLVLYSYTPNEELDSWQIVLAHLTSFLKP